MATNDQTQPLTWNVPIVDGSGNPTPEFIRFIQSFRNSINNSVPPSRRINTGHGLTGGGDLSSDRTISLNADLSDLNDVDLSVAPTDGQALGFDAASGKWIAETVGGSIEVDQAGTPVTTGTTKLNFTGSGVTVTDGGSGIADIAIPVTPPTVTSIPGWMNYTPTVSSQFGTITSYSINVAQYVQMLDIVFFQYDITITTQGSASGLASVSPPISGTSALQEIFGREFSLSGKSLSYVINGTNTTISMYDNTSPFFGNGTRWLVNGFYQASITPIPVASTVTGGSGGGGGGGGGAKTLPDLTRFTTIFGGSATSIASDSLGAALISDGTTGVGRGLLKPIPAGTGDFDVSACFSADTFVNFDRVGCIAFYDSVSQNTMAFNLVANGHYVVNTYANTTPFQSGSDAFDNGGADFKKTWVRAKRVGTQLTLYLSNGGRAWNQYASFTQAQPYDHFGFSMDVGNTVVVAINVGFWDDGQDRWDCT